MGVWQSLEACGTQPRLQGLAGSSTPVLVGREGTCLVPLRWEAAFAAAAVRMEMCWLASTAFSIGCLAPARSELLS